MKSLREGADSVEAVSSRTAAENDLLAALKESNKFWRDLQRGLARATELGATRVDVGDLAAAVRHVLAIEDAAIAKAEGR